VNCSRLEQFQIAEYFLLRPGGLCLPGEFMSANCVCGALYLADRGDGCPAQFGGESTAVLLGGARGSVP
jgi:hypothetical protein